MHVEGAKGRPARFASLRVLPEEGPAYALIRHGVQHFALWTDAVGEATLPRLPEGPVEVSVSLGSRAARAKVAPEPPFTLVTLPPSR